MGISDWSSDVCSSDLADQPQRIRVIDGELQEAAVRQIAFGGKGGAQRIRVIDGELQEAAVRQIAFGEIGRASCGERVCQYVSNSVVAVSGKNKKQENKNRHVTYTTHTQTHITK